MIPRILAAGIGDAISVIILVIAFLGWLLSLIGGKNQAPRGGGGGAHRPPRPRDDRISQEIDAFLREVSGSKRPQPGPQRRPPPDEVPIEIVPEEERRPRLAERTRMQARRVQRQASQQPPVSSPRRTGIEAGAPATTQTQQQRRLSTISGRKTFDSDELGAQIRKHLAQYMDEHRIDEDVQKDLRRAVDESVRQHLGAFSEGEAGVEPARSAAGASTRPGQMIQFLRNPTGIRQAIVLNEVLSPPVALRQRS